MTRPLERWPVAGAGGVTLISGFAVGVLHPTSAPLSWPKDAAELFWMILCVGAIFGLGEGSVRAIAAWQSARRRTSVTVGTVRGTTERRSVGQSSALYSVVVHVNYEVRRRILSLEWVSPTRTNIQFFLDRLARKYPVGRQLDVRYDPKEPENARLGRTWSPPVLSVALLLLFWSFTLNSSVMVGTTVNRIWFANGWPDLVRAVLVGDPTYHEMPCWCIAEVRPGEGVERVQVSVGIFTEPNYVQKFDTHYRLQVGSSSRSLPVTRSTAPSPEIEERLIGLGVACTPDAAIIVQGDRATAWPLREGGPPFWNTQLEQSVKLRPPRTRDENFDLICHELEVADGLLKVPVASSEHLLIRVSDGRMVGR